MLIIGETSTLLRVVLIYFMKWYKYTFSTPIASILWLLNAKMLNAFEQTESRSERKHSKYW